MKCQTHDCDRTAIAAIRSRVPGGKYLVTDIYQDEKDAPKSAARYCGPCTVRLAAHLAALCDGALEVKVEVRSDDDVWLV